MGCCVSARRRAADPPAAIEEEKVKEVVLHSVSETPISVPLPETTDSQTQHSKPPPTLAHEEEEDLRTPEISQASDKTEICSVSHSFSTTTTTVLDDDALSKPHPPPPSRPRRRERLPRSPAANSPQEKRAHLRPRLARERASFQSTTTDRRRNVGPGPSAVRRGGLQDGPSRRSRSPSSARVAAPTEGRRSPMKKRNDGVGVKKQEASGLTEKKEEASGGAGVKEEKPDGGVGVKKEEPDGGSSPAAATETIDNPLVSLECFIFL